MDQDDNDRHLNQDKAADQDQVVNQDQAVDLRIDSSWRILLSSMIHVETGEIERLQAQDESQPADLVEMRLREEGQKILIINQELRGEDQQVDTDEAKSPAIAPDNAADQAADHTHNQVQT